MLALLTAFLGGGIGYLAAAYGWRRYRAHQARKSAKDLIRVLDAITGNAPTPGCTCPPCTAKRAAMEKRN